MPASEIANLVIGVIGVAGMIWTAASWVGQQKQALVTLRTEMSQLKDEMKAHEQVRELVTRLDERFDGIVSELKRQPQVIALCVGEAIKAALAYRAQVKA